LFRLDLQTGQSTVAVGVWDSIALAFEPMSHKIYGLGSNGNEIPSTFWHANLVGKLDGSSSLGANYVGGSYQTAHIRTWPQPSLAFVPISVGH
jgi:hypothetical protein